MLIALVVFLTTLFLIQLAQGFRIDAAKVRLVPHGIEAGRFRAVDPALFVERYGLRDFVLQVSRINRLKGQARLIRALEGTGLQVVFIGPLDPTDFPLTSDVDRRLRNRYQILALASSNRKGRVFRKCRS